MHYESIIYYNYMYYAHFQNSVYALIFYVEYYGDYYSLEGVPMAYLQLDLGGICIVYEGQVLGPL